MSFDAIIQLLHASADNRRCRAADDRYRAANLTERAEQHDDVAQHLDLLADALATGQLTKDQLRAIVTEANSDAQDATDDGLLPDPLVMDADEYYASIVENSTYTDAQLAGNACGMCGREFGRYEDMRPFVTATRGELMQHSDPDDCKGAAK